MKTKNKILLLFLAAFVFVGTLTVRAVSVGSDTGSDGVSKNVTDTATLTITNVNAGDQFAAYLILDAFYNEGSNVISYEFSDDFQAFIDQSDDYRDYTVDQYQQLTGGDISSGSAASSSELDKLASAYAAYIKENSTSGTSMNTSGTTATATLEAGAYLVLPTQTQRVYAVMVGNLDFTAAGNNWTINNEEINAKVSDAAIEKGVGESAVDSGSYKVGDVVPYVITGTVPTWPTNSTNRVYTIKDTVTAGLDFQAVDSMKISVGGTPLTNTNGTFTNAGSETVATAQIQDKTLTITFVGEKISGTTVKVEYGAKINSNAVVGGTGNKNSASLVYSNDPYGDGTYTSDPASGGGDEATVFLYGIEIFKHKAGEPATALEGATFKIHKDSAAGEVVATVTTESDGYIKTGGLAEGIYYVEETKAPAGYQLLTDPLMVKIGPNQDGDEALEDTNSDGYYELDIANTEVGLLPVTGSIGTIILTVVGLIVVGGAIYFFVVYKKKKQNEQQNA